MFPIIFSSIKDPSFWGTDVKWVAWNSSDDFFLTPRASRLSSERKICFEWHWAFLGWSSHLWAQHVFSESRFCWKWSESFRETRINLDVAQISFPGWASLTGGEVQLWQHSAGSMKTLKTWSNTGFKRFFCPVYVKLSNFQIPCVMFRKLKNMNPINPMRMWQAWIYWGREGGN